MKNTNSAHQPRLLSITEVAWLLGVNRSHVCRAIRVGLLPVVRRHGRVLVPAHALAHLAENGLCTEPLAQTDEWGGA